MPSKRSTRPPRDHGEITRNAYAQGAALVRRYAGDIDAITDPAAIHAALAHATAALIAERYSSSTITLAFQALRKTIQTAPSPLTPAQQVILDFRPDIPAEHRGRRQITQAGDHTRITPAILTALRESPPDLPVKAIRDRLIVLIICETGITGPTIAQLQITDLGAGTLRLDGQDIVLDPGTAALAERWVAFLRDHEITDGPLFRVLFRSGILRSNAPGLQAHSLGSVASLSKIIGSVGEEFDIRWLTVRDCQAYYRKTFV